MDKELLYQLAVDIDQIEWDLDPKEYIERYPSRQKNQKRYREDLMDPIKANNILEWLKDKRTTDPEVVHNGTIKDLERLIGGMT